MTIPRNLSFLAEGASSSGVLGTAKGGTNLTSFTVNGIPYASSSSALNTSSVLTFDGTNFKSSNKVISGDGAGAGGSNGYFQLNRSDAPNIGSIQWITTGDEMRYSNNNGGIHTFYIGTEKMRIFYSGGVSIGNTTDPGAGALSVTGTNGVLSTQFSQTSTTAYGMTLSTLAPAFNFDAATCAVTVTSGNSISFSSSFSGVIMVTDTGYSGCTAVLICGGGGTLVLGNSTTTQYFTNSSLAGDYRFYNTGGAYQLFASARTTTFKIISFRTQNTT